MLQFVKLTGGFSWEALKFWKMGGDFSREVLKSIKFTNQKAGCFGYGRRIVFLLPVIFEGVFKKWL